MDGDCEVVDGWLDKARVVLEQRPDVAVVTGRRRERFPEVSVYNRLADLEWEGPVGEIKVSHGDIMIRADAFRDLGGFDEAVLVGEDYDLCLRLRKRGWILIRIDAEMTLHDMAMTRFGQWWRRTVRSGYGYADGAYLHGKPPERHYVREVRSILFWGLALPLAILVLAWPTRVRAPFFWPVMDSCTGAFVATRPNAGGRDQMRGFILSGACWPSFRWFWASSPTGSAGSHAVRGE